MRPTPSVWRVIRHEEVAVLEFVNSGSPVVLLSAVNATTDFFLRWVVERGRRMGKLRYGWDWFSDSGTVIKFMRKPRRES